MIRFYPVPDGTMSAVFKEGGTVALKETKLEHITNYLVYLIETKSGSFLRRVVKDRGSLVLSEDPEEPSKLRNQQRIVESDVIGIWEVTGEVSEETEIPEHHHHIELI